MKLKYKEREETHMMRIMFDSEAKTEKDVYREQRKEGLFNVGYHFIVLPTGGVKKGIPYLAYADYRFSHVHDSLYVLFVGSKSDSAMTDAQCKALEYLKDELQLEVHFGDD